MGGAGRPCTPRAFKPLRPRIEQRGSGSTRRALKETTVSVSRLRLGVNIDHVATVRNARGGAYPDPVRAARLAVEAGADGITAHLREDRRHIRDADMDALKEILTVPLNYEMAATDEMIGIALRIRPHAACLVPEKREERTTEGGLDIIGAREHLKPRVKALSEAGIRVSLFVEPDERVMEAARVLGAPVVELHTGSYCEAVIAGETERVAHELSRIARAAEYGAAIGLEIHAGHGLTVDSVGPIARLPQLAELNIGHAIIAEAIFVGLPQAVRDMRAAMDRARQKGPEVAA
ncbi:pyridoxine 5'-phosphate synthase [Methylobacterium durans]|uniref:Pyridoxine 5'-phosphate synthase n=1 Tax=Methylobacterium durans TaxID=2202825 RepID=A0A2U8W921_9HYPH|nr:pyridoxine 5'-phosphate synthase [Methylobacterium durans]